jgi:hypothetical protein
MTPSGEQLLGREGMLELELERPSCFSTVVARLGAGLAPETSHSRKLSTHTHTRRHKRRFVLRSRAPYSTLRTPGSSRATHSALCAIWRARSRPAARAAAGPPCEQPTGPGVRFVRISRRHGHRGWCKLWSVRSRRPGRLGERLWLHTGWFGGPWGLALGAGPWRPPCTQPSGHCIRHVVVRGRSLPLPPSSSYLQE